MIELEILSHTIDTFQQEKQLEDLGIEQEPNEDEGVWDLMTFININAFSPTLFYEGKRTLIYANGTTFVCKMNYEDLKEHLKYKIK